MKNNNQCLHLLFVDDDLDEAYLFNEALEQSGLQIQLSTARDGNGLIDFLEKKPLPDIVLLDLNMPHKDGMEALTEIRNNSAFDHLPLVIYSTTRSRTFIERCYEKGANLFVVKPDTFDGMVEVVKRICSTNWTTTRQLSLDDFVLMDLHS